MLKIFLAVIVVALSAPISRADSLLTADEWNSNAHWIINAYQNHRETTATMKEWLQGMKILMDKLNDRGTTRPMQIQLMDALYLDEKLFIQFIKDQKDNIPPDDYKGALDPISTACDEMLKIINETFPEIAKSLPEDLESFRSSFGDISALRLRSL